MTDKPACGRTTYRIRYRSGSAGGPQSWRKADGREGQERGKRETERRMNRYGKYEGKGSRIGIWGQVEREMQMKSW